MAIPYLACMVMAAATFHLPPRVLPAIQRVEGGAVGSISRNADGSADLGLMQVNTVWVVPLAHVSGLPPADVQRRLVADACFNIAAAALILRQHLNERHGNLMQAIGDYHSRTPSLHTRYQARVLAAAAQLFARMTER